MQMPVQRDQAVYGLNSQDTQAKVLALGSKLLPLTEIIAKAESEEQAKLTQAKLTGNKPPVTEVAAVQSAGVGRDSGVRCKFCKRSGHGSSPNTETRKEKCPAWNKKCHNCEQLGHFRAACKKEKSDTAETSNSKNDKSEISGLVTESVAGFAPILVGAVMDQFKMSHVEWDKEARHWQQRRPFEMPKIGVGVEVLVEDLRQMTNRRVFDPKMTNQRAGGVNDWMSVPDTGAQICVGGVALMNKLNLSVRDLVLVTQMISFANQSALKILGGVPLRVTVQGETAKVFCYISKQCKGMYLSLRACKDLRLVHEEFLAPLRSSVAAVQGVMCADEHRQGEGVAPCGCPVRAQPPP